MEKLPKHVRDWAVQRHFYQDKNDENFNPMRAIIYGFWAGLAVHGDLFLKPVVKKLIQDLKNFAKLQNEGLPNLKASLKSHMRKWIEDVKFELEGPKFLIKYQGMNNNNNNNNNNTDFTFDFTSAPDFISLHGRLESLNIPDDLEGRTLAVLLHHHHRRTLPHYGAVIFTMAELILGGGCEAAFDYAQLYGVLDVLVAPSLQYKTDYLAPDLFWNDRPVPINYSRSTAQGYITELFKFHVIEKVSIDDVWRGTRYIINKKFTAIEVRPVEAGVGSIPPGDPCDENASTAKTVESKLEASDGLVPPGDQIAGISAKRRKI